MCSLSVKDSCWSPSIHNEAWKKSVLVTCPLHSDLLYVHQIVACKSPSPLCASGEEQTMEHIIEACPLQRLKGGLVTLFYSQLL